MWLTLAAMRNAIAVLMASVAIVLLGATFQDVPGVTFPFISREENYPQFDIVVDREKAAMAGLSQRDIAQAALISLNSNVSLNPSIFTDPRTGNQYNVVVQLDEPFRSTPEDLSRLFVMGDGGRPVLLGAVAGLIPMALGIGTGSEANAPLARAVIDGLAVSTVLTLLLIPTLYTMLEERFPRRLEAAEGSPALQGETA